MRQPYCTVLPYENLLLSIGRRFFLYYPLIETAILLGNLIALSIREQYYGAGPVRGHTGG